MASRSSNTPPPSAEVRRIARRKVDVEQCRERTDLCIKETIYLLAKADYVLHSVRLLWVDSRPKGGSLGTVTLL